MTVRRTFSFSVEGLEELQEEVPFTERSEFVSNAMIEALKEKKKHQAEQVLAQGQNQASAG